MRGERCDIRIYIGSHDSGEPVAGRVDRATPQRAICLRRSRRAFSASLKSERPRWPVVLGNALLANG